MRRTQHQSQSLPPQQPQSASHHYSPEPMIYSGDHDQTSVPHDHQILVTPLSSFEYQADFSSQLTEVASKKTLLVKPQRNKQTECNNQPLNNPISFENESQKPGQKTLKKKKKHNFYLLGQPKIPDTYFKKTCFLSFLKSLVQVSDNNFNT